MAPVAIAPDVQKLLGNEAVQRLQTDHAATTGNCVMCQNTTNPLFQTLNVIVVASENDVVVSVAHTTCADSGIIPVPADALNAGISRGEDLVSGVVTVDQDHAILLISHTSELYTKSPDSGDMRDELTAYYLKNGWQLASAFDPTIIENHLTMSLGWRPEEQIAIEGLATLALLRPHDSDQWAAETDLRLECPIGWIQAAWETMTVDVYIGPFGIHAWLDDGELDHEAIASAFTSGRVVAARLPLLADITPQLHLRGAAPEPPPGRARPGPGI